MANPAIAQLIANGLKEGLPHPGRPETREGPRKLPLVAFRTAGLPADMREHVDHTALAVGEAIVHLIELHGATELVPRAELAALRTADADPDAGVPLTVQCRTCRQPILFLPVVNGRASVNPSVLSRVNLTCPHTTMEATP